MCFDDPNKISKGHFLPRVGTMSYLEISLSKKGGGVDMIQLSYSSMVVIFFGET